MRKIAGLALSLLMLGALASAAVGQGKGPGPGKSPHGATIVSSGAHEGISPGFENADPVESFDLGDGAWKITATGAIEVGASPEAPNCGLRADGDTMLAKQNFANSAFLGRSGFSLVGAVEGPATVDLVCYGAGGNQPFEHNMVAISGKELIE